MPRGPLHQRAWGSKTKCNTRMNKQLPFSWDEVTRRLLVTVVQRQRRAFGRTAESGIKKQAWHQICREFNATVGLQLSKAQLQTQLSTQKRKYTVFETVKNNNGSGRTPNPLFQQRLMMFGTRTSAATKKRESFDTEHWRTTRSSTKFSVASLL